MGERDERLDVALLKLKEARVRVEQLCLYGFCMGELLHPGFLKELKRATAEFVLVEHEAVKAAVEASHL